MNMKFPWDENIWFSPAYGVNYFSQIRLREGISSVTNNKYKKEREAWIMGMALFGINKLTEKNWWLQVPNEDPPDMLCMWTDIRKPHNVMNWREVEIMQITRHNSGTIREEVMKKLANKVYPKEYSLLIYLQRDEEIRDLKNLSEEIVKIEPKVADVWVLGHTHPVEDNYILFSLYPNFERVDFNLIEEAKKLIPGNYIKMSKSFTDTEMIRITSTEEYEFVPNVK